MGETISSLVFRPPTPTFIKADRFFYIEIPQVEHDFQQMCSTGCVAATPGVVSHNKNSISAINSGPHRIPAFFIKRRGARITVLFSHGNAEDLGMMYGRMKDIARVFCVNVLAYDYTGYGLSSGQPSEEMCYRNIEAAYKYLREERKIPPSHIVLYGRSLGSGPSCYLAKKTADEGESVAGLILHSPFLSIYRIVMDVGFSLAGDMFRNKKHAKDARCPVLVIHGTKDEVVPFWHGDELLRSFPSSCRAQPLWVEGIGHNNIENRARKDYVRVVSKFLNEHVLANKERLSEDELLSLSQGNFSPMEIPENEQYNPEQSLSESGKFVINKTWVQHGADIVNEAISKKGKKATRKKGKKPAGNSVLQPTVCRGGQLVPYKGEQNDQIVPYAQTAQTTSEIDNIEGLDISHDAVSRFIMTREKLVRYEEGDDDDGGSFIIPDTISTKANIGVDQSANPFRRNSSSRPSLENVQRISNTGHPS